MPTGVLQGKRLVLYDWQIGFLRAALALPAGGTAALSVARKNGKSGLIAALLLGYLVGPLNKQHWRCLVASLTAELAKELRHQVMALAETASLPVKLNKTPTPGIITGLRGAQVQFLAADKASGHASSADLVVIDELGLFQENKRHLWDAMRSSVSARQDGRVIAISIKGNGPMMAELEELKDDPGVVWHEYAAAPDCQIDDPAAWAAANPGLGTIKSLDYMETKARQSLANPADQAAFRAHELNLPQSPAVQMVVQLDEYLACVVDELPERAGYCYLGLDLGGSSSMTALCAYWPDTGRMETWGAFPGDPGLADRGQADGVGNLYERMAEQGNLLVYPGRVTPVTPFLRHCAQRLAGVSVALLGCDRYRRAEGIQAMELAGVHWPVVWRGTGAHAKADGSHDIRAFQAAILAGRVKTLPNLVLEHAIASSSLRFDHAGNPALDKASGRRRIDAVQAAVIATGLAAMNAGRRETTWTII